MNSALSTSLLVTIALAGVDVEAKPLERCILSLEARPANVDASGEPMRVDRYSKPRCPLAVTYPGSAAPRNDARSLQFRPRAISDDEARLEDPMDAEPESIASPRQALHV